MLVVIDCQTSYPFRRSERALAFLQEVIDVISNAKQEGSFILVIELRPEDEREGGSTMPSIVDALKDYKDCAFVASEVRDKSTHILQLTSERDLIICGANLDECIIETVKGLISADFEGRITIGPVFSFNHFNEVDMLETYVSTIEELMEMNVLLSDSVKLQYEDDIEELAELEQLNEL